MNNKPKPFLPNQRFGRLQVMRHSNVKLWGKGRTWWVKCDCGLKFIAVGSELRRGSVRSCGCLYITHGFYGTPTYSSWSNMHSRAHNPNVPTFKYVGARGLKVCKRWNSFESFLEDMGERPSRDLTLDRIDNDKGYFKSNCRWATKLQQSRNRRCVKVKNADTEIREPIPRISP